MKKRRAKTVAQLPTAPAGPAACLRPAGIRGICPGCDLWKVLTHCPCCRTVGPELKPAA